MDRWLTRQMDEWENEWADEWTQMNEKVDGGIDDG